MNIYKKLLFLALIVVLIAEWIYFSINGLGFAILLLLVIPALVFSLPALWYINNRSRFVLLSIIAIYAALTIINFYYSLIVKSFILCASLSFTSAWHSCSLKIESISKPLTILYMFVPIFIIIGRNKEQRLLFVLGAAVVLLLLSRFII